MAPRILLASLAGAALLGAPPASAEVSIAVAPALLELQGQAGARGEVSITVGNRGDEPFEIVVSKAQLQDMDGQRSVVDWSAVEPGRLRLLPGDEREVQLTIAIPEDAASGGRYATIIFTTVQPGSEGTAGVAGRIIVPVLLTVQGEGDLSPLATLERAAVFLERDGRLGARADVSNPGNVHLPLSGSVELSSPGTGIHADLSIPLGRVLPGSTRSYSADSTLPLPLGATYAVVVSLGPPDEPGYESVIPIREAFEVEATPTLALATPTVCENLDQGPTVSVALINGGSLGIVPTIAFEVDDEGGSVIAAWQPSRQPLAWPQETSEVSASLSEGLPSGAYTLVASAEFGIDSRVEMTVPFSIGGDPATAAPLCAQSSAALAPTDRPSP